jgi:ubiquinone/menaquinone biosynthesis C-methylase UbiE
MLDESKERYWQNWDKGDTANRIDEYWLKNEGAWRENVVSHIKSVFGINTQMIEIGCGSGLIYGKLLEHQVITPQSYIGGDVSWKMLEIARQRYPAATLASMDIFNIPLANQSQENVINIQVLHHLPHYKDALKELVRITKKRLYINTWLVNNPEDVINYHASGAGDSENFHNNFYSFQKFFVELENICGNRLVNVKAHQFAQESVAVYIDLRSE